MKKIMNTMSYSIKTMFKMDKVYFLLLLISTLILSIIPFINMYLIRNIINYVIEFNNVKAAIIFMVVLLIIITLLQSIDVIVMWNRSNHYILLGHKFDIIVAKKTLDMKYENAENPSVSDLRMRAAKGCSTVSRVGESITDLTANIIKIIGCSVIFVLFSPFLLVIILIFTIIIYLIDKYVKIKCYENEQKGNKYERKIHYFLKIMLDYVAGKEIRIFKASNFFAKKYKDEEDNLYLVNRSTHRYKLFNGSIGIIISAIQLFVLYLVISKMYFDGNALIGDIILYINTAMTFSGAFLGLIESINSINIFGKRIKDFQDYLNIDEDDHTSTNQKISSIDYVIEFDHVWFKYNGTNNFVLQDISLKIDNLKKIAIVGENGSGKTTLMKLLLRFYTPTKGRILINGIDYLNIDFNDYYLMFSAVLQDFKLLAFTIKENIDFHQQIHHKKTIEETLERLELLNKIENFPKGLDTHLTQEYSSEGINLSGGERQKLAIARADYKDAPILILDEPTSALDPIAEKKLYDQLYYLMNDKIVIMISHRLQSTQICDQIFLIKNGRIEEQGNHSQLMDLNGTYRKMFETQASWYKDVD